MPFNRNGHRRRRAVKRYYFISDDMDALGRIEAVLRNHGIIKSQIHVLSKELTSARSRDQFHNIAPVLKQEIAHDMLINTLFGALAAVLILAVGYITRLPDSYSWTPFYLLAITIFGLVSWSVGLYGFQVPDKAFLRLQKDLDDGKHIFIVDVESSQEQIIRQMEYENPYLIDAGIGSVIHRWISMGQKNFKDDSTTTFP